MNTTGRKTSEREPKYAVLLMELPASWSCWHRAAIGTAFFGDVPSAVKRGDN